jgi:hypothetical protein
VKGAAKRSIAERSRCCADQDVSISQPDSRNALFRHIGKAVRRVRPRRADVLNSHTRTSKPDRLGPGAFHRDAWSLHTNENHAATQQDGVAVIDDGSIGDGFRDAYSFERHRTESVAVVIGKTDGYLPRDSFRLGMYVYMGSRGCRLTDGRHRRQPGGCRRCFRQLRRCHHIPRAPDGIGQRCILGGIGRIGVENIECDDFRLRRCECVVITFEGVW